MSAGRGSDLFVHRHVRVLGPRLIVFQRFTQFIDNRYCARDRGLGSEVVVPCRAWRTSASAMPMPAGVS